MSYASCIIYQGRGVTVVIENCCVLYKSTKADKCCTWQLQIVNISVQCSP